MKTKAKDLKRGDVFRMHVYGEIVCVEAVAGGKRFRVRITLENQGGRNQCGARTDNPGAGDVEFTDDGSTVEFICKPSRAFQIIDGFDDDDDDEDGR